MIISVINGKGGTGKTTTCVNLAAHLAGAGYRTLVADLDPLAGASVSLGLAWDDMKPSMADLLFDDAPAAGVVRPAPTGGADLIPGDMELVNADLMLAAEDGREDRLAARLAPVAADYDAVFIDCPPSLSLLCINALCASDGFIAPFPAEFLSLEGLVSFMCAVDRIRSGLGVDPQLLGVVFTMTQPARNAHKEIAALVRKEYGERVFNTEIRRDAKLSEAPAAGKTIFEYAPESQGAKNYARLAAEVVGRCGLKKNKAS